MATRQSDQIKEIQKDLHDLRKDMGQLVDAIGSNGSAKFEELKHRLGEASREMAERLRTGWNETYAHAQEGVEHAAETSRKRIQERPLTIVIGAFAAGLIVEHFLTRR